MKNYNIILCEGETDQTLIGSYLENISDWKFTKNVANPFPKENIWWYKKGPENLVLGIWQVGGNSFTKAIEIIFEKERLDSSLNKIIIVTDHDDDSAEDNRPREIIEKICEILALEEVNYIEMMNNWLPITFRNSFSENRKIDIGYILVPISEQGALETFMMNAIAEQSPEKNEVITQSRNFVENFASEVYLRKRRDKIKAELGVSLSIFSPDRIFTTMKELIDSVKWDEFETANDQFNLLKQI